MHDDAWQEPMTQHINRDHLQRVTSLKTIECHAELMSTMDRARALAVDPATQLPALVIAADQRNGRGRRGAGWWQPSGSLAMTFVMEIPTEGEIAGGILPLWSLVCGLAVVESLQQLHPELEPLVRWPNDIEIKGRKLAGLLVEATTTQQLLIGIGINTAGSKDDAPPALQERLITVPDVLGTAISHNDLLGILIPHIEKNICDAMSPSTCQSVLERYKAHCSLTNTSIKLFDVLCIDTKNECNDQVARQKTTLVGFCRGTDKAGRLLIETPHETLAVLAGSLTDPLSIWKRDDSTTR
jgi:BirA family biotin operon repressor/biotin-[acetyl-CoA-carboxylase] ligase